MDITKLAQLTGLHLTAAEMSTLEPQLESVITMLEKVKKIEISKPTQSWHELLGLTTNPSNALHPDSTPDKILSNVQHPVIGHAVEVAKFIE